MLEILAHRGWWRTKVEQNSETAFVRAMDAGYGIETDIRDRNGVLVVSHDPPNAEAIGAENLLKLCAARRRKITLALNVKADGLATALAALLARYQGQDYFVFDMSVPDTLAYLSRGMKVFARRSEFETGSTLDNRANGLWLDSFEDRHVPESTLTKALQGSHDIALVSPELHGKPHLDAWRTWRDITQTLGVSATRRIFLCTDYPDEAEHFFAGA